MAFTGNLQSAEDMSHFISYGFLDTTATESIWIVVYILIAFLCGSIPFSVWLGKLFLKSDVRQFGDGNPGATNVFRAGGKIVGVLALMLDISKSAVPVGLAYNNLGLRGIPMFLIALAPILGHAFSPFLRFKGGKALAVSLGVWIGLTSWKASLVVVLGTIAGFALTSSSGWAVMFGMYVLLAALLFWMPDLLLVMIWAGQTIILSWTHRFDLRQKPRLRSWLEKRIFPGRK
jgi:glycerol-3-phosphate acyltransferase PlsY